MPTYNRADIIARAIQSVQAQTNPHWQLVIIDDGSSDDTRQIVQALGDERIVYRYQSNTGPSAARNHALQLVTAPWIAYLDSDNELFPTYLETMLEHLARAPQARFAIPKGTYTYELYQNHQLVETIDWSDQFPEALTLKDVFNNIMHIDMNGLIHARSLLDEGVAFDPTIRGFEDWDLVMQMGNHHPDGFLYVPVTLYAYHQRYGLDGIIGGSSYADQARKYEQIYRKHRYDALMQGQTWFPAVVHEWDDRQHRFEAGELPPAYLYPFTDQWLAFGMHTKTSAAR